MASSSTTAKVLDKKNSEETLVYDWIIFNHPDVVSSGNFSAAKREFQSPVKFGKVLTWNVGYKMLSGHPQLFGPYIKLVSTVEEKEIFCLKVSLLHKSAGQNEWKVFAKNQMSEPLDLTGQPLIHLNTTWWSLRDTIDTDSDLTKRWKVQATLSVKRPSLRAIEYFKLASVANLQKNLGQLITDPTFTDLKIICSDGVELTAHRTILYARNPVFASMLTTNMKERNTGILEIDDISGSTMKILLEYLYTGDLPEQWQESENIVEMTYASGKYQLTDFHSLLDNILGESDHGKNNLKLLGLANKLSLKNAESRLLKRIHEMVCTAGSTEKLHEVLENLQI